MRTVSQQHQEFVARVVAGTDIVQLIGESVKLKARGMKSNSFMGCCPFHDDRSPSFSVSGDKQIYHCFGCDAGLNGKQGGDAITFVRRQFPELGFREAVAYLANRIGVDLPRYWLRSEAQELPTTAPVPARTRQPGSAPAQFTFETDQDREQAQKIRIKQLSAHMQRAHTLYSAALFEDPLALTYLKETRRLSDETIKRYAIGYAPDQFDTLTQIYPYYPSEPQLLEVGLVKKSEKSRRYYDFFRDRVLFGIRNRDGQLVAYGGRRLKDSGSRPDKDEYLGPKYLNSPESALFNKRTTLFGLYEAKEAIQNTQQALIVEGYMDVLGLASHGINNAVASMGTAITPEQLTLLENQGARQIVFVMDGDLAGQKAMFRSIESILSTYRAELNYSFVSLPDNLDPDEYVHNHGAEALKNALNNALDLDIFIAQYLKKWAQNGLDNTGTQTRTLEQEVDRLISLLPKDQLEHPRTKTLALDLKKQVSTLANEVANGSINTSEQTALLNQMPRFIKQILIAANRLPIQALNQSNVLDELLERDIPAHNLLYQQYHLAIGMGMQRNNDGSDTQLDEAAAAILANAPVLIEQYAHQSAAQYSAQLLIDGSVSPQEHLKALDKQVRMRENSI